MTWMKSTRVPPWLRKPKKTSPRPPTSGASHRCRQGMAGIGGAPRNATPKSRNLREMFIYSDLVVYHGSTEFLFVILCVSINIYSDIMWYLDIIYIYISSGLMWQMCGITWGYLMFCRCHEHVAPERPGQVQVLRPPRSTHQHVPGLRTWLWNRHQTWRFSWEVGSENTRKIWERMKNMM